jgi:hypothetical protein
MILIPALAERMREYGAYLKRNDKDEFRVESFNIK